MMQLPVRWPVMVAMIVLVFHFHGYTPTAAGSA
jgi:hypothetical protein